MNLPNPLFCVKCNRQVQNLTGQHVPHQNIVIFGYQCHGEAGQVIAPVQELQEGFPIYIGTEFRRVKPEL
jgi:hypothetical protein